MAKIIGITKDDIRKFTDKGIQGAIENLTKETRDHKSTCKCPTCTRLVMFLDVQDERADAHEPKTLEQRQQREYEREQIINNAVQAADRIIMDGSDGSVEETNWLTSQVAKRFVEKVDIAMTSALSRKDLGV